MRNIDRMSVARIRAAFIEQLDPEAWTPTGHVFSVIANTPGVIPDHPKLRQAVQELWLDRQIFSDVPYPLSTDDLFEVRWRLSGLVSTVPAGPVRPTVRGSTVTTPGAASLVGLLGGTTHRSVAVSHDELRALQALYGFVPAGEDPLKHVVQAFAGIGCDVSPEDKDWAHDGGTGGDAEE